jgi:hypothetical protein
MSCERSWWAYVQFDLATQRSCCLREPRVEDLAVSELAFQRLASSGAGKLVDEVSCHLVLGELDAAMARCRPRRQLRLAVEISRLMRSVTSDSFRKGAP